MRITTIESRAGRTYSHPAEDGQCSCEVVLTAALDPGDDPVQSLDHLRHWAETEVEHQKQQNLKRLLRQHLESTNKDRLQLARRIIEADDPGEERLYDALQCLDRIAETAPGWEGEEVQALTEAVHRRLSGRPAWPVRIPDQAVS